MTLTPVQKMLYREVSERLERHPETHHQGAWYDHAATGEEYESLGEIRERGGPLLLDDMEMCGTTACVAGHTVLAALDLGIEMDPDKSIGDEAARLLGLSVLTPLFSGSASEVAVREWMAEAAGTGEMPDWMVKEA